MQKIDGYYLYRLGAALHPLSELRYESEWEKNPQTYRDAYFPLVAAETALDEFLHRSVFQVRSCLQKGVELLNRVRVLKQRLVEAETPDAYIDMADAWPIQNALTDFEAAVSSELGVSNVYLVTKKGGYDTTDLIENGQALFQAVLARKVPDAIADIEQATRCIAFELPTAAGFHLHRANESVLKGYYDAVRGEHDHPKDKSMGVYLAAMEKHEIGDKRVRAALKDIKDLHRNPLIHPQHSLETVEEAIDLLGAIRAAIGAMLPAIREVEDKRHPLSSLLNELLAAPTRAPEGGE